MDREREDRGVLSYRNAVIMAFAVAIAVQLLTFIVFHYGWSYAPSGRGGGGGGPMNFKPLVTGFTYNFIVVLILYFINFRLMRTKMNSKMQLAIIIISTFVATLLLTYLLTGAQFEFIDSQHLRGRRRARHYFMTLKGNFMKDMFLATVVVFSSQLLNMWHKKQQIDLEYKTLVTENMRTRYEALKSQIDPHFLFNTLNTLKSIISIDPPKAEEYTQQLSEVLRYTLQNKDETVVESEIEFTKSYCNLMQIRYGDSLNFEFDIDEQYSNYHIIPLSVQTLVENAIKHNVISNRLPLTVKIYTSEDETLTVENTIQPKKEPRSGEGIGLANLSERYRLMWKREIEIFNDGEIFKVTVPIIKSLINNKSLRAIE